MRLQLSHCTSDSFLRTSANTAGRKRTWQMVQRSPSARATAVPRTLAMRWKVSTAPLLSIAATILARSAAHSATIACCVLAVAFDRGALRGDLRLRRLERRFRLLDGGVDLVGGHHVDEDALLVLADFVRDRLHLVLHRVQLLVGLHRHDLLFVLVVALLRGDQVLVDGAAVGLIVGEGLLGGGEGGRGGLQQRVERRNPAGRLGDRLARDRRPAFDVLQLD